MMPPEPTNRASPPGVVDRVVRAGEVRTPDMGGRASTMDYADALVRALE